MRILVTGVDGYVGAVLAPTLMQQGHDVVGLDTGYYRTGWLYWDGKDRPPVLTRDIRKLTEDDVRGFDAIVHLAELSNDPLGEQDPERTFDINHRGSVTLAKNAKAAGVTRFVYASSCSVYGAGNDDVKDETSAPNPQTAYAKCKVMVERDVGALADDGFSPVFLRNATAFGASPRMRFDIVLNNLAGLAWTTRRIQMTSDGTPWRPLVHVRDMCRAVACALEAPRDAIHNQIFNVGDERQNYRVREIAEIVGAAFPGSTVAFGQNGGDNRSYRVSFDKIHERLPGFACRFTAEDGARELHDLFQRIGMDEPQFNASPFVRLKQLRHLLSTRQIDADFYWRTDDLH